MNRTLSLTRRRTAVAVQLLSYPLLCAAGYQFAWPTRFVLPLALVIYAGASVYLYRGTGFWQFGNAPDDQLDERQVQVRNRAYRLAYATVCSLVLLLLAYLLLAPALGWAIPPVDTLLINLFYTAVILLPVLPSAILAWTESDG